MKPVTHAQFEQIKTHFEKLRNELDSNKLATFAADCEFFRDAAPYNPVGDAVMHNQWSALLNEVKSAQRAAELHSKTGETLQYAAYKAAAARGEIDGHPGAAEFAKFYAETQKAFFADPALYHRLREQLGGLTREQMKGDLPS